MRISLKPILSVAIIWAAHHAVCAPSFTIEDTMDVPLINPAALIYDSEEDVARATIAREIPAAKPGEYSVASPVLKTFNIDGSTNEWSQADLIAALQLMNRKYHRDIGHPSGRTAWHGRMIQELVDTESEVKYEYYEDGSVFRLRFRQRPKKSPKPATFNADGVPVALARARERREQEKSTTNEVTVIIQAQ